MFGTHPTCCFRLNVSGWRVDRWLELSRLCPILYRYVILVWGFAGLISLDACSLRLSPILMRSSMHDTATTATFFEGVPIPNASIVTQI